MGKEERIICFHDTFEKSNTGSLKQRTEQAIKSNRVYKEGFVSKAKHRNENKSVEVCPGTTFEIAKKYAHLGKTAVLNFANPENPGGGVQFGAMAQEECLCRSSNLFACLSNPNVFDEYYGYHRNLRNRFYTDRLIYTKNVTVFKDDSPIPQMLPEKDWFDVDAITCAAPYLGGSKYTNLTVLRHLFQSRITNILEAALDNCVDTIVLGAFGCGAFKNPAQLVAEEFRSVIENGQYCKKFKNIVFAIKKETEDDYGANYHTFATVLRFPLTENCPTYDLPEVVLPTGKKIEKATVRFHRLPTNTTIEDVKDLVVAGEGLPETYNNNMEAFEKQRRFLRWQRNNPYYKKQFSVLGDSISTLDGYNPKGYKVFYENDNCVKSGVVTPQNTWWGKVIEYFGGELLVNNSWSGSRVTKLPGCERLFPSGCSDERTSALHINDVKPDVILVYLGTNDWAFGAETGEETRAFHADCNELFSETYDSMLRKIKSNYPHAEIWCCTLCETYISNSPDFTFPHKYGGTHIEEYNERIRSIVKRNSCRLVDLYQYKMPYDTIDGTHPTAAGMNTIATMMVRSMGEPEAERVLGCEDGQHDFRSPSAEDPDAKGLALLEAAISTFAKSDHKDAVSLRLIIAALEDVPLYLPVEIDLEAMLRSSDPTEVKAGRIITLKTEDGGAVVPMFTSNDEVNKGPSASVIRFYPQDYLPKLIQMDKSVMINPFSENRFVLPQ